MLLSHDQHTPLAIDISGKSTHVVMTWYGPCNACMSERDLYYFEEALFVFWSKFQYNKTRKFNRKNVLIMLRIQNKVMKERNTIWKLLTLHPQNSSHCYMFSFPSVAKIWFLYKEGGERPFTFPYTLFWS